MASGIPASPSPGRRCVRRGDGNAEEPPLIGNVLKEKIEIDLLRPRRKIAGEVQETALVERRQRGELRRQKRRAVKVEIAPPQVGKALRQVGGGVADLEIGRENGAIRLCDTAPDCFRGRKSRRNSLSA